MPPTNSSDLKDTRPGFAKKNPTKTNSSDLKDTRPGFAKKQDVSDQANWDLAKTHLKAKKLNLARKVLTELTDHPNRFKLRATKKLEEINK